MAALESRNSACRGSSSSNIKSSTATTKTWTTARCHRLIRPLTSKLHALRNLVQSPSVTIATNPSKETKQDPAELPYDPSPAKNVPRRLARRSASDRDMFLGESRPGRTNRVRRTYSANPTRNTTPQVLVPTVSNPSVYDLPFPAAAIDWDPPGNHIASVPTSARTKSQTSREPDSSHPQFILRSLKHPIHPLLFNMYTGIYSALETILIATAWKPSPCEPVPLKILAARRMAQCILATQEEMDADDAWYDTADEVGVGGEYLREIVRWQAIELIRDAICADIMPSQQKSGLGLPSALIGLCRHLGANAEAESLLKTMIELYPLSESTSNPSLVALMNSWKPSKATMFRILTDSLVVEGSPIFLGNPTVNKAFKSAVNDVEQCNAANNLITKALESGFGIWGNGYVTAASNERKQRARRKGSRRSGNLGDERNLCARKLVPTRVGQRAEEMALFLIEKLVVIAQIPRNTQARGIIKHLTHGFLVQDEVMRDITEGEWAEWYPIAGKVVILLQGLGQVSEDNVTIVKELVRCLDDVRETLGKDGLRSLGEFVASCYENLYTPSGKSITGEDEMKILVNQLISYASTGSFPLQSTGTVIGALTQVPKTPLKPSFKVVTFTPGKKLVDPRQEKERYYITQLALNVAIGFSTLKCAKQNDRWNSWVGRIEHQIIGMKFRTPAKAVATLEDGPQEATDGTKARKGWRWEEGLDEWIAVGGTPGGPVKGKVKPRFKNVEIPMNVDRKRTWRKDYEAFSDALRSESSTYGFVGYRSDEGEQAGSALEDSEDEAPRIKASVSSSQSQSDSQNTRYNSEDPDTSCSLLFENDQESSASDADYVDGNDTEYYAPTPARPPSSVRRSPRKTERIKRSLRAFAVVLPPSSPIFSAWKKSETKAPDFTRTFGTSSPSPLPPSGPEEVEQFEEEAEDDGLQVVLRPPNSRRIRKQGFMDIERDSSPFPSTADSDESEAAPSFARKRIPQDSSYENGLSEDELSIASISNPPLRRPSPVRRTSAQFTRRQKLMCITVDKKRKAKEYSARRISKKRVVSMSHQELSEDKLAL